MTRDVSAFVSAIAVSDCSRKGSSMRGWRRLRACGSLRSPHGSDIGAADIERHVCASRRFPLDTVSPRISPPSDPCCVWGAPRKARSRR